MFIIWFGVFFGRLKGEFQQFNYVYVCISFTHPLYIKSQKLVYGYIIINVYTIFFGCWIICHLLYQLNCLQFSQLIVYIGFSFLLSFHFYFWYLVCCFSKRFTHSLTPWYNILLICSLSSWLLWVSLKCRNSSVW